MQESLIFLNNTSNRRGREKEKEVLFVTVKLSSSLFVGKLGLTLRTCEAVTSGTVPEDAAVSLPISRRQNLNMPESDKTRISIVKKKGLLPLFDGAFILIGPQGVGEN